MCFDPRQSVSEGAAGSEERERANAKRGRSRKSKDAGRREEARLDLFENGRGQQGEARRGVKGKKAAGFAPPPHTCPFPLTHDGLYAFGLGGGGGRGGLARLSLSLGR